MAPEPAAAAPGPLVLPRETLVDVLHASVAAQPAADALEFLGRRWTYAALGATVAQLAAGLHGLGIRPGDRVGLCLPNTHDFVAGYFATLRLGAVVVSYSPLLVAEEIAWQVADSGTAIMLTLDLDPMLPRVLEVLHREGPLQRVVVCRFTDNLPPVKAALFRLLRRRQMARPPADEARVVPLASLLRPPAAPPLPQPAPEDLAVLQYTGGTTGRPKGVMLTHANLCANLRQVQAWRGTGAAAAETRILAVIPFFHIFALTVALHAGIAWGAEIILQPRYERRAVLRPSAAAAPPCCPACRPCSRRCSRPESARRTSPPSPPASPAGRHCRAHCKWNSRRGPAPGWSRATG